MNQIIGSKWQATQLGNGNILPIFYIAIGTICFSFLFTSAKFIDLSNSVGLVVFIRYLSAMIVLASALIFLPKDYLLSLMQDVTSLSKMKLHFGRSLSGGFGGLLLIYSVTQLPIATASAISLLDAIFMIFLGVILFQEKLNRVKIIGH